MSNSKFQGFLVLSISIAASAVSGCSRQESFFTRPVQVRSFASVNEPAPQPSSQPSTSPSPAPSPAPSASPNIQQITIGQSVSSEPVDVLLLVDNSGSMAPIIQNVKNNLNALIGGITSSNLRFAVQSFGQASGYKAASSEPGAGPDQNAQVFPYLFQVPGTTDVKYNTLNPIGLFFGSQALTYDVSSGNPGRASAVETIRNKISSISLTDYAQQENGLFEAMLGYQTVLNSDLESRVPADQAFRRNARAFHTIVVSDEDAQFLTYGPRGLKAPPARSCYWVIDDVCNAYETITDTYSCPTDTDPTRMCSRTYQRCTSITPGTSWSGSCPFPTAIPSGARSGQYQLPYEYGVGPSTTHDVVGYLNSINEFKALYSPNREFKMNAIVKTGGACGSLTAGQSIGTKYVDMASRTGGTSHCIDGDISGAFANIAQNINQTVLIYDLLPGRTVSLVRIRGGATLVAGTHYSVSGGRITFVNGAVSNGQVVEVVYN